MVSRSCQSLLLALLAAAGCASTLPEFEEPPPAEELYTEAMTTLEGGTWFGVIPRVDRFDTDPKVPGEFQVDDHRGYRGTHNPWDRGHLVRRRSLHWGDEDDARTADEESFYWTNIAPQHRRLHSSAWGKIERWMFDRADDEDKRACVFTGPVFTPDDPWITNRPDQDPIQIPAGFWKIFVMRRGGYPET